MGATSERLCAVSVDLDEIHHYAAIHGLQGGASQFPPLVYGLSLERFAAFAEFHAIPLTLFSVGTELRRPEAAAALRNLARHGHEIANHTLEHRYDLTRLSEDEMRRQVRGGIEAVAQAVGAPPSGFRAPGYTIDDRLVRVLEQEGVFYDSSVFPSVPYYTAKALALALIRVRGRESRSILDTPRVLTAPTQPYRLARTGWFRKGDGLVELPVQVTPVVRYPFIGTFLTLAGPRWAQRMASWVARRARYVCLELHGIDLLDDKDGLEALVGHQPDVPIPYATKRGVFDIVVDELRRHGFEFVTCHRMAERAVVNSPER